MAAALGLGWLAAACGGATRRPRRRAPPQRRARSAGGEPRCDAPPSAPKFTGTLRVTGLGVDLIDPIKDGGRDGARLQARLRRHRLGDDGAEGDHAAGLVRRLLGLHVPVQPGVALGQLPQRGDREDHQLGADVPAHHAGQGRSGLDDLHLRRRRRPVPHAVHRSRQERATWHDLAEDPERARRDLLVSWVDEATGQTVGDEPLYTIGAAEQLQHGLDGLQRRRHPEGAGRRSTGPSCSTPATRAASRCSTTRASASRTRRSPPKAAGTDGVRHDSAT